jgi:6,7-dimethyl-8-ribityllumazine synthase|tara:strand:- start:1342 stop:1788 length:447 start_codon:yes stop_codon:yes gene_type:complete
MSKDGFTFSSKQTDVNKKITIVASKWNAELVDELLRSGKEHLEELGFTNIKTVNVPGAWELVHAAQRELAHADGVIAYGVVIKGETTHYELISESVAHGLMQVSVNANKPIGFGLIAAENLSQAQERTDSSKLNKGKEIAQSLVEMLS